MKYGVPHYDSDGRLTGVSFDNDGDGVFDDYQQVHSTISEGDDASIIGADIDGDGVYDDTIYVSHRRKSYDFPTSSESAKGETGSSYSSSRTHYSGRGLLSGKQKLKIALIILGALVGFAAIKSFLMIIIAILTLPH